jgi:predicted TIM-barrel enzyme
MAGDQSRPQAELSDAELELETAVELPTRAAMSLVSANIGFAIDAVVGANVLSDDAATSADATQDVELDQSN